MYEKWYGKINKMDRMRHLHWSRHNQYSLHGPIFDINTVAIAFLILYTPDRFQNKHSISQ